MFTSSQIEEIRKKLQLGGAKDTQFPLADSLKGNETVAIVQQGINKQLGIKAFIESVARWSVSDFLNISKSSEDSYTLEEVLKIIAPINRKAGQVITFKDKKTGTWSIYQFKGNDTEDWFNLDYWDDILAKVDNHFKGLILNDCILNETYPRPMVGDFAFVGSTLEEAVIYICYNYGHWHNTEEPALAYMNSEIQEVVENIFNNISNYPELVELISKSLISIKVVSSLPEEGKEGIIYLLLDENSTETNNLYKEYVWIADNSKYEEFGNVSTKINLNDYVTTETYNTFRNKFIFDGNGTKFLSDDGTYKEVTSGISEVPQATSDTLGGVKLGYTANGKNYPVILDTNGKAYVNVPWTDNNTTYSEATTTTAGLMSTTDKTKLNNVAENANNYIHPTYTARTGKPAANQTPGFGDTVTVTQVISDNQGHVSGMTDRTIKIPNAVATQESAGLMSAEDKIRLDGVTGSNVVITTSAEYTVMQAAGTLDDNTVYFLKG